MKIYYQINIDYDSDHWPEYDDILKKHLGYSSSAGLGFGARDHQYDFDTKVEADAFHKKAVKALAGKGEFSIDDVERCEY